MIGVLTAYLLVKIKWGHWYDLEVRNWSNNYWCSEEVVLEFSGLWQLQVPRVSLCSPNRKEPVATSIFHILRVVGKRNFVGPERGRARTFTYLWPFDRRDSTLSQHSFYLPSLLSSFVQRKLYSKIFWFILSTHSLDVRHCLFCNESMMILPICTSLHLRLMYTSNWLFSVIKRISNFHSS